MFQHQRLGSMWWQSRKQVSLWWRSFIERDLTLLHQMTYDCSNTISVANRSVQGESCVVTKKHRPVRLKALTSTGWDLSSKARPPDWQGRNQRSLAEGEAKQSLNHTSPSITPLLQSVSQDTWLAYIFIATTSISRLVVNDGLRDTGWETYTVSLAASFILVTFRKQRIPLHQKFSTVQVEKHLDLIIEFISVH